MSSEDKKDGSTDITDEKQSDVVGLSKDDAKKYYEEKGIDLSPDVPTKPKPIPQFEKSMADKISSKFADKVHVAKYIRDDLRYDHAESVTGVDYPDSKEIEVVYHLGSYTDEKLARQVLTLATRVPREEIPNPGSDSSRTPSLRDVFYRVEFHERECFEMFGVYFEGHPDNRRLLLPEDWADIPPFRKDFKIKGR